MKILISDFDDTFFTENYEDNIFYTNKFVDNGNVFIIATGRPIYLLEKDIKDYDIRYSYIICNDGAVIFDKDKKVIYRKNIDQNDAKGIYNILLNDSNYEQVYIDTSLSLSDNTNDMCNGIIAKPLDRSLVDRTINQIIKEYPSVYGYLSHKWLNILNKDAGKAKSIEILIDQNKWHKENIITIGDNKNDLDMIKEFNGYLIKSEKIIDNKNYNLVNNYLEIFDFIRK